MIKPDLDKLESSISDLRNKQTDVAQFCELWRSRHGLHDALPPRYRAAMEDLLCRLETGSAFSEESCSYSQEDLIGSLWEWLDQARNKLKD